MPIELYIKNIQINHFTYSKMGYFGTRAFFCKYVPVSATFTSEVPPRATGKSLHSSPRGLPYFYKEFEKSSLLLQDTKLTEIAEYFMG